MKLSASLGHQFPNRWLVGTGGHTYGSISADHTTGVGMFAYVDFSFAYDNLGEGLA